ncbi:hypothetical protein GCM10011575_09560 [Microlunatus endophyticus]|uniref:histidine kinase n=1 Tax=Microlunatus endophyticus TaxID=1716077 RepID=A0A917S2J8_9ACTN|nr:PAS domain S-box protein [Microlunatus endophyticus]GGL53245.1 hypothetical protein GCM10011575_09560 [Microlunatus endophyticus]
MTSGLPTVVVVDDSDGLRRLVRLRLHRSGMFDVVGDGKDGTEAIGLAYQHQPTLLLLDTSMPGMDGLEALPGIMTVAPETRVVMYTGFEGRSLADVALELGAVDFVEKSFPIDQLPDRLAKIAGAEPQARTARLRMIAGSRRDAGDGHDQEVLNEHLERYREVFDVAAIGMATLTLNGSVVRANAALAALLHCDAADLVGLDYGQFTCGQGAALDSSLEQIRTGQSLASFEHEIAGYADPHIARATVAPVRDREGAALYALLQVQDITAQRAAEDRFRRSEERFQLLIDAVEEYAIFMLDTEGRVSSWNPGAQRIKGYRTEEIVGQHFRVFYPEDRQRERHPEYELQVALEKGSYAEEGWRIRKDGSRFWASVVITAVVDRQKRHIGFAKVTRDQTERRVADENREHVIELQRRLLAVTGHELRTPAAVIDGSVETVLQHDQLDPDEREQLLAGVRTSTRQLHQMSADLLTASRLDAETLALHRAPISLHTLLSGAAERARIVHPEVSITVDGDLETMITVDSVRLGQAIDNLISNAIRHGRPPIAITADAGAVPIADAGPDTAPAAESGHDVVITVSDAGRGVDPGVQDRLFDRFVSGPGSGGAGLGLYVVREICRIHGGEAEYRSADDTEPGRFVLTLPRR